MEVVMAYSQPATKYPVPLPPRDGEENWKKKVKAMGCDKNSLIIEM